MPPDGTGPRALLAAVVGLGFVTPSVGATLAVLGLARGPAFAAGVLVGLAAATLVFHTSTWDGR